MVGVVQSPSCVRLFTTPWTAGCQGFLVSHHLQEFAKSMSIESVISYNHLILCCPLLLLPSVFPSIRAFSNDSAFRIRWPKKYWSFSFSICPSEEYSGLISFKFDRFDLFAFQGTLKSLLQHHSPKASILWCLCFLYGPAFIAICDYWKDQDLTVQTLSSK